MASVLITGAEGFIGRALACALSAQGYEVIALGRHQGDIAEQATWANLPSVSHVFHLAARTFVPDSWKDPASFLHTNVVGTSRAVEYVRACNAHLVFISGYVYGVPKSLPISEDDLAEPNNPYALSKFLAEQVCAFSAVPATVLRAFNVFGPGQRSNFLIPSILDQIRAGVAIKVKDLTPRRDYIYIDDLLDALIRAMQRPRGYWVFNIGSGVSYSVQEVIDVMQAVAGTSLPIVSEGEARSNEIPDVRADIRRAKRFLGWAPRLSLNEGLARLLAAEGRCPLPSN
jgi:GDP-4-dehydro-6-deoxy-D-mannose reductase